MSMREETYDWLLEILLVQREARSRGVSMVVGRVGEAGGRAGSGVRSPVVGVVWLVERRVVEGIERRRPHVGRRVDVVHLILGIAGL